MANTLKNLKGKKKMKKTKITAAFLAAAALSMGCLSATVSAENGTPTAPVSIVAQQLSYSTKTDISTLSFSKIGSQEYDPWNEHRPSVTIKDGSDKLKIGTDYRISFENNKEIGTATITITGIGKYTGTKKINFKIVPPKTNINAIRTETGITVSWNMPHGAEKYQLYYSENGGKFKKLKTTAKTSYTTKKLNTDSKLRFKVRSYAKVNGKTYYSKFSDIVTASEQMVSKTISFASNITDGTLDFTLKGVDFDALMKYCKENKCDCYLTFKFWNDIPDYPDIGDYSLLIRIESNSFVEAEFNQLVSMPWHDKWELDWDSDKKVLIGKLTDSSVACTHSPINLHANNVVFYASTYQASASGHNASLFSYANFKELPNLEKDYYPYKKITVTWN